MPNRELAKADILQGTLDLMVPQTLVTIGPLHGYAFAARLEQVSGGSLQLNMGTLYTGLMRLEQRGLVRAAWGVTDNNRKARFYTITTPTGPCQEYAASSSSCSFASPTNRRIEPESAHRSNNVRIAAAGSRAPQSIGPACLDAFAQPGHKLAPPEADHATELRAVETVPRRVARPEG